MQLIFSLWKSTKARYTKKQLFLRDMSDLWAMNQREGMFRRLPGKLVPVIWLLMGGQLGYFLMIRENQIADSPAASCYWNRFMGKRGLRQTMLAIAVIYGSDLYKEFTPVRSCFPAVILKCTECFCPLFEFPLEILFPASIGTRITLTTCTEWCKDFFSIALCIMDQTFMPLL